MERIILHSDMNNFYASVECLYHPELRGKPVAVAGDPEARHGIVLAKNYPPKPAASRRRSFVMARQKCPDIVFTPPHYDRYMQFSTAAREIYSEYTDQVEPYGLDECWLDVTGQYRPVRGRQGDCRRAAAAHPAGAGRHRVGGCELQQDICQARQRYEKAGRHYCHHQRAVQRDRLAAAGERPAVCRPGDPCQAETVLHQDHR